MRRDAIRPGAKQQDYVENNQSSAEAGGDRDRDQLGCGEMRVKGHAVQASAQGVKRPLQAELQRDSETRAQSPNVPMPDSDMDMNSMVTSEQCEQRIQQVLKVLGLADRRVGPGLD